MSTPCNVSLQAVYFEDPQYLKALYPNQTTDSKWIKCWLDIYQYHPRKLAGMRKRSYKRIESPRHWKMYKVRHTLCP